MSYRYLSYLGTALVAGFIVVATQAFATGTVMWLAFAAGVVFILGGLAMLPRPGRQYRGIAAATSVLGALIVIEALLSSGSTMVWFSFAGALGILALAIAGLTAHELSTERVVHSLEVPPGRPAEAGRERAGMAGWDRPAGAAAEGPVASRRRAVAAPPWFRGSRRPGRLFSRARVAPRPGPITPTDLGVADCPGTRGPGRPCGGEPRASGMSQADDRARVTALRGGNQAHEPIPYKE